MCIQKLYCYEDLILILCMFPGMVVIAGFVVILSILMFFFPRQIKQSPQPLPRKKSKEKSEPFFKGNYGELNKSQNHAPRKLCSITKTLSALQRNAV